MKGPIGLDVVLGRLAVPGTDYSNRVTKLESMCRVAICDLERLVRHAAREEGACEEDLEERVRIVAGAVVRMAAQRAVQEHRSATRRVGRAEPGPTTGT